MNVPDWYSVLQTVYPAMRAFIFPMMCLYLIQYAVELVLSFFGRK